MIYPIMIIKIIRHSERYDYSYPHRWIFFFGYYWADTHLTTEGRKKAAARARLMMRSKYHVNYIYTSPYIRTMETATEMKTVFGGSQIIIESLLSEYQPYWRHNVSLYPDGIPTSYQGSETEFSFPETKELHRKRIDFIINKIIEKHDNKDNIIIITHGEVIKTFADILNSRFPDLILNTSNLPYLVELSFEFDKNKNEFIENTIIINHN